MIDTKAIRTKVLDLAIRGKLTEQRPEDGTAEELYAQIQAEKQALIAAGKIKREKALPEIRADEVPFEVPKRWKWVRLDSISAVISKGTTPRGGKVIYGENGVGFLRAENLKGFDKLNLCSINYIDESMHTGFLKRSILEDGDILISIAGTLGRTGLVRHLDLPLNANQAIAFIRPVKKEMLNPCYVIFSLNAKVIQNGMASKKVEMAIPNLSLAVISSTIIPLPPLPEQHRIVAKIDAIFSLLDTIDALQSAYTANQKALRAKLIDAAIRGQLTEQLPEDGTAEELYQQIQQEKAELEKAGKIKKSKPLAPVAEEEKAFEIPENWMWTLFGEVSQIHGTGLIRAGNEQYESAEYYYFKMNNIGNFDGICHFQNMVMINATRDEYERYKLEEGDFLFNTRNSKELVGKTAVVPPISERVILNNNILKIRFLGGIEPHFMNYYFLSAYGHAKLSGFVTSTTNVAAIYQRQLVTMAIPLPPLAEQKRIVARLEELLAVCGG